MTSKCQPMRVNITQNNVIHGMVRKSPGIQREQSIHQGVYGNTDSHLPTQAKAMNDPHALMQWEKENG